MATKKPTSAAKPKSPAAKKPASTASSAAAKSASVKGPTAKKPAKTTKPVVMAAPKRKTPTKAAAAKIVDAEVIKVSPPKPKETPKDPAKTAPQPKDSKPDSKALPIQNNGSWLKTAGLMVVGAILAAGILFAVDRMPSLNAGALASVESVSQLQEDVDIRLGQLEASVESLDAGGAVDELATAIDSLRTAIDVSEAKTKSLLENPTEAITQLETRLAVAEEKLTALENAPVPMDGQSTAESGGIVPNSAEVATLKTSLAALEQAHAELASQVAALTSAQTELQTTKSEVVELTATVQENTAEADIALALTSLTAAVDNGTAFDGLIQHIEAVSGVSVPTELSDAAATGIKPLYLLQQEFPEAARIALKSSILAHGGDGVASKLNAFVKSQISARSLNEREGDDPDAVLSRAEGALSRGDLKLAVSLVNELPEAGLAAMESWLADARTRVHAQEALARLSQSLAPDN